MELWYWFTVVCWLALVIYFLLDHIDVHDSMYISWPRICQQRLKNETLMEVLCARNDAFRMSHRQRVQSLIYQWARSNPQWNNSVNRQEQRTHVSLHQWEQKAQPAPHGFRLPVGIVWYCYGCNRKVNLVHGNYVYCCQKCGPLFEAKRHAFSRLNGQVALVIGARTKLGHQVTLKLLRAGCTVVGTTRHPQQAMELFAQYPDYTKWSRLLHFYPVSLDLDQAHLRPAFEQLRQWIQEHFHQLNLVIYNAAQTIRARDKPRINSFSPGTDETNRYGDPRYVHGQDINSWHLQIHNVSQAEMEEVVRINAIGPCILLQTLQPLLKTSIYPVHIVHVHAREGLFEVKKTDIHVHSNMAKAALHMLTKCLAGAKWYSQAGRIRVHGVDPGWISVDEYYEHSRPWLAPPLDEIDGAARILHPIFSQADSCSKTVRHYYQLSY